MVPEDISMTPNMQKNNNIHLNETVKKIDE